MQNQDLILKYKTTVITAWTDMYSRLKPGALVNLLIQSAIESADLLGFGFKNLKEFELFWVLNKMQIEILKPIFRNQELWIETWPKNIDGWFYIRDFFIKNGEGEILAKASSAWLALDSTSKRPKKMNEMQSEKFIRLKDFHALTLPPQKLEEVDLSEIYNFKTTFFDFDLNGHVTSSRYVDWMMDVLDFEFHKEYYPKIIIINYLKEILPGNSIEMHFEKQTPNSVNFEGKLKSSNLSCVRASFEFQTIKI